MIIESANVFLVPVYITRTPGGVDQIPRSVYLDSVPGMIGGTSEVLARHVSVSFSVSLDPYRLKPGFLGEREEDIGIAIADRFSAF